MKKKLHPSREGYQHDKIECCKKCLCSSKSDKLLSSKRHGVRKKQTKKKKKGRKKSCGPSKKPKSEDEVSDLVIYSIVNTDFFEHRGSLAAEVAKGFLGLYMKVEKDRAKSKNLDEWEDSGERLIVLNGINHKHLRYLVEEVYYVATEYHCLYREWGKSRIILVLTVLGRQEDLMDILEILTILK